MLDRVLVLLEQHWRVPMGKTASQWLWMKDVRWPLICILYSTLKGKPLVLAGFTDNFGSVFATPGIAEKGNVNVLVEVTAPGGHSSVPPPHTVLVTFVVAATYIPLIEIIHIEHWHPLCASCTLWAQPLQGQACQSSQPIFPSWTRPHSLIT